jgi:signal transduction histidine kinase
MPRNTHTVEDNGVGMSEPVRNNLFKRFFSTKGSKGTGLGLMVVQKIVEEHGGTIDVESVRGQGSSFLIRLPYVQG